MIEGQKGGTSRKIYVHDAGKLEIIEKTKCCLRKKKKGFRRNVIANFWKGEK